MLGLKIVEYVRVQTLIVSCLNIGEVINGYGVAWSAPIIPKLQDPTENPFSYQVTQTDASWIAAGLYFGSFGALLGGYFANKIGRKKTLILGGVTNLLSYVLQTAARNLTTMMLARTLVGMAMSLISVTGLIYIGEITSPNIRGITLTSMGVFHAIGGLVVYSVGPFVSYAAVSYVVMAINVVYIVACCFLPESPMYYVIKDDEASAKAALQYLGRDIDVNSELKSMIEKFREQQQQTKIWSELFTRRSNQRSLLITIPLAFFQQSSGIIAVILFATSIFQEAGSSVRPDIATIIVGAAFVVGTCVTPVFIEKYGRKVLLLISSAGCCIFMAILGVYFYLEVIGYVHIDSLRWLPLFSLVAAIFMYSVGLTIIPNSLSGELFTPKVRGIGPPIVLISGWISGLLCNIAFGYAVVALGSHVTFWIFAAINGLDFVFVLAFVPETKGKSLMEIQVMLEGKLKTNINLKTKSQDVEL